MTKRTTTAAAEDTGSTADTSALAMPSEGGSYIRKEDGSLERVAFTNQAQPAEEPADAGDSSNVQEG